MVIDSCKVIVENLRTNWA